MEKDNRLWELIAKKSAGEATAEEIRILDHLMQQYGIDVHYMMSVMDSYWEEMNAAKEGKQAFLDAEALNNRLKQVSASSHKKTKRDYFFLLGCGGDDHFMYSHRLAYVESLSFRLL
jgi:hypothetical protein